MSRGAGYRREEKSVVPISLFRLATFGNFGLISNQRYSNLGDAMSDPHTPRNKDRNLEQALTNKIIDDYFENSESWLRAILRMCIFSLAKINGESVFIVECPNQAVAKRLSRKTYPFRGMVYFLTDNFDDRDRSLFCYKDEPKGKWRCFDTSTNTWEYLSDLQSSITPSE
ncbi:hypothetical protein Aazo_1694 ['Nostoc azollae' 0708]|uniref:Uncharacterized protein n=2 Tax=Trichormus azollae TaxID=1164 RepID=D7E549_NOSA0|nr:hypothetical protein Aazo_1694 ['Nostoc azollae' 0708]